jgi:hypothetical protein
MDWKRLYHRLEKIVDKLIPFMLVLLLIVIVTEWWFHDLAEQYHTLLQALDFIVIGTFVLDLIFKWFRIRTVKRFVRKCWPDILAVFPFFLFFRFFEGTFGIFTKAFGESVETAQAVLHEGVGIEKEGVKVAEVVGKQSSKITRITRTQRFSRFIRPVLRAPRFVKAMSFFEEPHHKKHSLHGKKGKKPVVKKKKSSKKGRSKKSK